QLDKALATLKQVDTLLPCSSRPPAQRDLARIAFLQGAALLDMGKEEDAAVSMAQAVVVDLSYEGERGFPGPHLELLAAQRGEISSVSPGHLFIWPGPGMAEVFVDGLEVERANDRGLALKPGKHLVQIVSSTGLRGMWVTTEGQYSTLIFPNSGRSIWEDGGRSLGGEQAMRRLLQGEFQGRGDVHTIHYVGRRGYGATFPADGGPRIPWTAKKTGTSQAKSDRRPKKSKKTGGTATASTETSSEATTATADSGTAPAETQPERQPKKKAKPRKQAVATPASSDSGSEAGTAATDAAAEAESNTAQAEGSSSKAAEPPAGESKTNRKRFRAVGSIGYQFADPFHYAMVGIDVSLRIRQMLEVNAFIRPSYGGNHSFPVEEGADPISGPVFFVPFGATVGVRKQGWLSPWVAGGVQLAYNRDGLRAAPYLLGPVVHGGLDFSPNDSILVIRVQGEVGVLAGAVNGVSAAHFNARLSGGAGIRF
ncbi:MAG: hypothetical protein VX498_14720, partial [Myxococcota bacterium]|nr:hypothetical protein [Myxococcota bacterium]